MPTGAPETLYRQPVTGFALRLFVRPDSTLDGESALALVEEFRTELLFPDTPASSLWMQRARPDAKLAIGEVSERRWKAAVKQARAGDLGMLRLSSQPPGGREHAALSVQVNPTGSKRAETGAVWFSATLDHLRRLIAKGRVDALLRLATVAWNEIVGEPAYGYANLTLAPPRHAFDPSVSPEIFARSFGPRALTGPPVPAPHAIPVAHLGSEADANLEPLFLAGTGIRGAYWANFLSRGHVARLGGPEQLQRGAQGMRLEALKGGGMLVIATDTPLPDDSSESRERFQRLRALLEPAFFSRREIPENKRALLGDFLRD